MKRWFQAASLGTDVELLGVVLFWAFNITVVKLALRDMAPLAFNTIRFVLAAVFLLALTHWREGSLRVDRRDIPRLVLLALVGHTAYQLFFIEGIALTTASSVSLIFGTSPVVVALLSRAAGHEHIRPAGLAGALLAFSGVCLIVLGKPDEGSLARGEMMGDLLVVGAVICWAAYTVLSRDLLARHSPLKVTALTLSLGTLPMFPVAAHDLARQDWAAVSTRSWLGVIYSAMFALVVSYICWYRSVKKVGNLKTAIYSNLVPLFGTLFGVLILGERLTAWLWLGGACILCGIILTRRGGS